MIPILYRSTEQSFATNGTGALPDCTSCVVTQERNGAYTLDMEYPADGVHGNFIFPGTIILAKPDQVSRPQPFRVYEVNRRFAGTLRVRARHIAYDLDGYPAKPFTAVGIYGVMDALPLKSAYALPFTFTADGFPMSSQTVMTVSEPTSIWSLLSGSRGGILDLYGGEYEFDRYEVKLHKSRGLDTGMTIAYGKNLTDLTQEESTENVYSAVYPYYIDEQENTVTQLPEMVIETSASLGFKRVLLLNLSSNFQSAPTQAQLRAEAQRYIDRNKPHVPRVSISVKFVPLEQTEEYRGIAFLEQVNLCDSVTVEYPKLGVSTKAKVIKIVYDVLKERCKEVELGDERPSISSRVRAGAELFR